VVEKAASKAALLRSSKGINDPDPDNYNSQVGKTEQTRIQAQMRVNEQSALVSQLRATLEQIEKLKPEELMQALRTIGIEDMIVQKNLPLLQDAGAELERILNSGLGENHPRVRALVAQRAYYSDLLSQQLDSIRRSQATKLRVTEDALAKLTEDLEKAEKGAIDEKTDIAEYVDAKSDYIQAKRILENAELTLKTERMKQQMVPKVAVIWEKAEPAIGPAKPNVPAYMALAGLVGIVVGVGLAFFIEYLDTSVKTLDDVERYLQIPVLAVIPKNVSILIKSVGDSPDAEAYRILRAAVEFNKPYREANTFTLISGGPGEGKSTTLNNLAYTCAKGGYNVLVVDADLRRATQHHFFDADNSFGLTDYLLGRAEIDEIIKTTKIDNLSFIPSGQLPGDAVGILNSQRMTDLIAKVKSQYDLVFFDSPPILGVSDGSVLASEVDITMMVVQHRRFPRVMLQRVKQAVLNVGGRLIGVVLNNVDAKHDDGYSYYNSYNEYYGVRRETPKIEPPAAPQLARPRPASREEY
jgi:capsular exopolysaccharide synthesis family protein